ncbi:MAG: GTP cyclohydrolase [Alphaproteobacteria bacterium CG11_big_fil_rev_8_21_14_0_20_39_49]|nr:MAG: GTP cyclohydrolase [Alphaproteobacteria bacterium CG11_big_fil_rev_8_21_14_0_20_39_49]
MLLDKKSKILLSIERAINEIKLGLPVIIKSGNESILTISPETANDKLLKAIAKQHQIRLTITQNRLNFINNNNKTTTHQTIIISPQNLKDIPQICGLEEISQISNTDGKSASDIENEAIELSRIAELIPSMITFDYNNEYDTENISVITEEEIQEYKRIISLELKEACRTKLTLRHEIKSQIIAYRSNIGGKEHYAIVIGKISDAPVIRIHSSCYTGDLLDSLACDCHDQLHTAIEFMNKEGGGIILYMLQEGRGIGLINKLRAYTMKEKGFDTVDANEALGFNDDERLFEPAATILKKLNINQVQLLTNNPKKAKGLEECGIKVIKCVPHIMETNKHNESYIKTKSERLGHKI